MGVIVFGWIAKVDAHIVWASTLTIEQSKSMGKTPRDYGHLLCPSTFFEIIFPHPEKCDMRDI